MGLDMYLRAKKYINKIDYNEATNLGLDNVKPTKEWSAVVESAGLKDLADRDIYGVEVSVVAAYWRKANQIHGWFVDNIQKGADDCGEYYVSKDKLQELLDTCKTAYITGNSQLLEPTSGFFFGSNDIDAWYWHKIEDTITQLEYLINRKDFDTLSFYYQSSW